MVVVGDTDVDAQGRNSLQAGIGNAGKAILEGIDGGLPDGLEDIVAALGDLFGGLSFIAGAEGKDVLRGGIDVPGRGQTRERVGTFHQDEVAHGAVGT